MKGQDSHPNSTAHVKVSEAGGGGVGLANGTQSHAGKYNPSLMEVFVFH